jgi:hypothetical protein
VTLGLGRGVIESDATRVGGRGGYLLFRLGTAHEVLQAAHPGANLALGAIHLALESRDSQLAAHTEKLLHAVEHDVQQRG